MRRVAAWRRDTVPWRWRQATRRHTQAEATALGASAFGATAFGAIAFGAIAQGGDAGTPSLTLGRRAGWLPTSWRRGSVGYRV